MPQNTTDTKPLYAVAGLADLAVEKLRALPARMPAFADRAESAATTVREKLAELPADLEKLRAELPGDVQKLRTDVPAGLAKLRDELPADVQKLRDDLPAYVHNVQTKLVKVSGDLADAYDDLSVRGEGAVKRFRKERAGELRAVSAKVADTADKAADVADKVADDISDAPAPKAAAKPKTATPTKAKVAKKPAK
jgi:hypothetical protein